jgi:hypothetical protein
MVPGRIYLAVCLVTSMTVWGTSNIPIPVVWWAPASPANTRPNRSSGTMRVDRSGGIAVALVSVGSVQSTGAAREEVS